MGPRIIMCLDMDAFFASVECTLNPELRGKPIVVGGHPQGRGVVTSASYEARAYGVRSAMPLAQARRLCPQAVFVPRHSEQYWQASRQVRSLLEELAPCVEMASIDEAFIDLSGSERSLGHPLEVARQAQERVFQELGLPCSIGLAGNKLVAKITCSQAKPRGLRQVPAGQEASFLAPLPVTVLPGVGPRTAERLAELRIRTCGHLATAPLLLLQRLLGQQAASLQRRARGIDKSPVITHNRPALSISRSTTFAEDTRDPTFLRATLYSLVERVGQALRRQKSSTNCLAVQVRWANFTTQGHQRMLAHPTASDARLYQVAGELLDDLLNRGRQRVRLLGVRASHFGPQGIQLPLLLPERTRDLRDLHLSRCLDQLRERYGFASIQRGPTFFLREQLGEIVEDNENDL